MRLTRPRRPLPSLAAPVLCLLLPPLVASGSAAPAPPAAVPGSTRPAVVVPPIDRPHPRLSVGTEEIRRMRDRVASGREPFRTAWLNVKAEADAALEPKADPRPYTERNSRVMYDWLQRDAMNAEVLAYAYTITQDERYAARAAATIDAWATAEPRPGSNFDPEVHFTGTGMFVARSLYPMLFAYDLIYHSPSLTDAGKKAAEDWFRSLEPLIRRGTVRWHNAGYFHAQDYQNHLIAHTAGIALIGWTIGDREMVQFAIDSDANPRDFAELIGGLILMPGDRQYGVAAVGPPAQAGEITDKYRHDTLRGLQYCHLSMAQLVMLAEVARQNGMNFYRYTAPGGENIRLPLAFYADFWRTRDSSIKGGFYAGEDKTLAAHSDWHPGIYEVAARQYPDDPDIRRLLTSIDRAAVPRHPHTYFCLPLLSHGLDPEELSSGGGGPATEPATKP